MRKHFSAFKIRFLSASQKIALQEVLSLKSGSVIFCNAHVVVESSKDPLLLNALQKASCVIADGTPIAWLLSLKGHSTQRYSGPDFMMDVFRLKPHARHFFLGSTLEVLEKIKNRFEGNLVGYYSPPFGEFSESEIQKQIEIVNQAQPDFIWVGLGAPKQEKYVVEMASRTNQGVWLAVGAAFDFFAQTKPRAPQLVQKIGMEWAFRMLTEPRRLTKRYVTTNPRFIALATKELLFKS